MRGSLACYVSGHGFGHATRAVALVRALRTRDPGLRVRIRTQAPGWIFHERDPEIVCSEAAVDPGVIQTTGLDVDVGASLQAQEAFLAGWDSAVEREVAWLSEVGASVVVGDVPPLAFAAAARAGLPSAAVANFTWEWIFGAWAAQEPRCAPVVSRYAEAHAAATLAFRLPLHPPDDFASFPHVVDVGLLANRAVRSRAECRAGLGIEPGEERRLVLVSFGGFRGGRFEGVAEDDLSEYLFLGIEPGAPRGFPGEWRMLKRPTPIPHEEIMSACDAVIGKAGFSTVAEALVHDTRFLYLPRTEFPETRVVEAGLERHGCARPMPREDFERGRWRPHLDALFEQPHERCDLPADGAEQIAAALLELASRRPPPRSAPQAFQ